MSSTKIQVIEPTLLTEYHNRLGKYVKKYNPQEDSDYSRLTDLWQAYTGIVWESVMILKVVGYNINPTPIMTNYAVTRIELTHSKVYDELYKFMNEREVEAREVHKSPALLFPRNDLIEFMSHYINELRKRKCQ